MKTLEQHINDINRIFREETDRYKAHELARPILLAMAKDRSVLHAIITKNLARPGFLEQKRINPVIALDIETNETVSFVAHCWLPLPDRRTDITHQSIHHHGKLLLTSVAAFGAGYESILFKNDFRIDRSNGDAQMTIEKIYRNDHLNLEFIGTNTPHVVFYPAEFSITYALWTNAEASRVESMKKIGIINKYKKQLRKLIDFMGASKVLGLNVFEYLDFYPENGKLKGMKDRVMYPVGTNESFLKGVFRILQLVGYDDLEVLKQAIDHSEGESKKIARALLERFNRSEPIEDAFEKSQLNIPNINLNKNEILRAFKLQQS